MTGRIIGDLKDVVAMLHDAMAGLPDGSPKDKVASAIKSLESLSLTIFQEKKVVFVDDGVGTAYVFPGIDQPCCVHCFEASWNVVELIHRHWIGKRFRLKCPSCEQWECSSTGNEKKRPKRR